MARKKKSQEDNSEELLNPLHKIRKNKSKLFKPKNKSQEKFLESISKNNIVFNIGSAGTGKTYAAVAYAVETVTEKKNKYRKLLFVRPSIEACGENLGFLPGSKEEKLDPYMQPIYDVLFEYGITRPEIKSLIDDGFIEIVPLAYMRGRSLNNCLVIVEEAQNMNSHQMEMLLTRLGHHTKFMITGDITQRDIQRATGIEEANSLFKNSDNIDFIFFESKETLRDPIVQEIVEKYAKLRNEHNGSDNIL